MATAVMLRFRDLVTEQGGTIREHTVAIRRHGDVWWAWWMRQYETAPIELFEELVDQLAGGVQLHVYLVDSGVGVLYRAKLKSLLAAPSGHRIATPQPSHSPPYYQGGKYPAWFCFTEIAAASLPLCALRYHSFPSRPGNKHGYAALVGAPVESLEQLRAVDVTLWVVQDGMERDPTGGANVGL